MSVAERIKINTQRKAIQLGVDVPLLLVSFTLVVFGLLMVFSASSDFSWKLYGSHTQIFSDQVRFLLIGLLAAGLCAFFDYRNYRHLVVLGMVFTIGALIYVVIQGELRHGATRTAWEGSYMPSEMAKIATIIYLSVWLNAKREKLREVGFGLIPLGSIIGVISGLILFQPDLSAAATIIIIGGIMFFLAGGELKQIALVVAIAVVIGWGMIKFSDTGAQRLFDYQEGLRNPLSASYHVRRSFEAFVNGGWFGVGIGLGETKVTGLPFPHTDSIFAVVGEETGVFGAASLAGLFVLFIWRGMKISSQATDRLGRVLAAGLTIWIGMEAFINMLVMVGLMPFAGNALPFISSGGSSLIVSMAAVGILINISRRTAAKEASEGGSNGAVVDLRRGHGGWRVSRANRPESPRQRG